MFLSKVCEESNKIIENMLANKRTDGESIGPCHVSISITNGETDNNVNTTDSVEPKGIKKKECSCKSNKLPQSWNEKLARKKKVCISRKKGKPRENLVIHS